MDKLNLGIKACGVFLLLAMAAIALPAQALTTLDSFDNADGNIPAAALVQANNGDLYGTTFGGGATTCDALGCGTVFKITPSGTLTMFHNFDGADGEYPLAGLVQGADGDFYGTTTEGGRYDGTIFEITPSGALTTLYVFDSTDGDYPRAGLVHATDGNFYGTTYQGGANGDGTVFTITPSGKLTTLYNFCSQGGDNCTDGGGPAAGLVQATDGSFYGTTLGGGANGSGTVFQITTSGKLTTLHSFGGTDGAAPYAGLVQDTNGNFYGTTTYGGANSCLGQGCGTVFKITSSGKLTTLHSFENTDGAYPGAGLIQGTDGNLYGTTSYGGVNNVCGVFNNQVCGTIFKITPSGKLTTLYSFCSQIKNGVCSDGNGPAAALVQDTNGTFYGTTDYGGANASCYLGCGTVFSLSVGLGPFCETQPTSGVVGKTIRILGTNLTGATSVTFNGTQARFTVVSKSLITTTVPLGATTGNVKVTAPHGTLKSNVPFTVQP